MLVSFQAIETRWAHRRPSRLRLPPNEAATILNCSRMYVIKLVNEGVLPYRMFANHHRIPYADLAAYKRQQQTTSRTAMDELYQLERDSIVDGPPPLSGAFKQGGARGA